jgi:lipoprotein-anchoring transpeptidase ErfK/SrfK
MPAKATHTNTAALATLILLTASTAPADDMVRRAAKPATDTTRPSRRIVVSIPDRKLALIEGGRTIRIYATAVGAPSTPSPSGTFTVATRISEPTYYAPGKVIQPGSANPLGTRWLGLSLKGFGIRPIMSFCGALMAACTEQGHFASSTGRRGVASRSGPMKSTGQAGRFWTP